MRYEKETVSRKKRSLFSVRTLKCRKNHFTKSTYIGIMRIAKSMKGNGNNANKKSKYHRSHTGSAGNVSGAFGGVGISVRNRT